MNTNAVVIEAPQQLALRQLELPALAAGQVAVDIEWTGISTGTERLLWSGDMPHFPGMGYPLVPGYESVGRVSAAADEASHLLDQRVFVPGANCYGAIRGLFGGSASRLVVDAERVVPVSDSVREDGVLLALAATAYHAMDPGSCAAPDLIIGHGVLGRLLARLALVAGAPPPTVWERNPQRISGKEGYRVVAPEDDEGTSYGTIYDASGDASIIDSLIGRLRHGGELVLAGFYSTPIQFSFPPAFMKEPRLRIAAQWQPGDLSAVARLVEQGALDLGGLITHTSPASAAPAAYRTAFEDGQCLKMILDWSST